MAFTVFPQLPPEIRCSIFLLASQSEPRIVPIQYDEETISYRPRIKPPVVLRVNRECRHEALKVYHELRLGRKVNTGCYINPLKDFIYLRTNLVRPNYHHIEDAEDIDTWRLGRLRRTSPTEDTLAQIARTSLSSDPESGHSSPLNFDVPYKPHHPKIVFNNLIHSEDREVIFKSLHVNYETWSAIWRYYAHLRHTLPIRVKELCLVYEGDSKPLSDDFQMKNIPHNVSGEEDPYPLGRETSQVAWRIANSLSATAHWSNREDVKMGQPAALQYRVRAKYIAEER